MCVPTSQKYVSFYLFLSSFVALITSCVLSYPSHRIEYSIGHLHYNGYDLSIINAYHKCSNGRCYQLDNQTLDVYNKLYPFFSIYEHRYKYKHSSISITSVLCIMVSISVIFIHFLSYSYNKFGSMTHRGSQIGLTLGKLCNFS